MRHSLLVCCASAVIFLGSSCAPSQDEIRSAVRDILSEHRDITRLSAGKTLGPYSPAVTAGNFVFLSGQIGLDPSTDRMAGPDIASQTQQALKNMSKILRDAGLDSSAVVQCTVYLKDIGHYPEMNALYGDFFGGSYPARTTVEVSALPAGALIEIAAIAYRK